MRFTTEQRAELDIGLARILEERDVRDWASAITSAIPVLMEAAADALGKETRADGE